MKKVFGGILAALAALSAQSAFAAFGIVGTTGNVVETAQPASATVGTLESNSNVSVWFESNGALASAVSTDASAPGTYSTFASLTGGSIASGTNVSSYMLHSDTVGSAHVQFSGSVTFSGKILGVIVLNKNLVASDFLTMTSHSNHKSRGYEMGSDRFTISADGKTLTLNRLDTSTIQDEMRIITAVVPEPASIAIWSTVGLVLGGAAWRRRKKASL